MSHQHRRSKMKNSSAKDRMIDNEYSIPVPSRQGELNEKTDFTLDPSLIFDELPQPFRRINKVLESIFDDAWTIIEQREQQRMIDQTKFVSAQHTSSTLINTPVPVSLIGSHISGTLVFLHGIENDQSYILCYDNQLDETNNQITIDHPLKQMIVMKSENVYFLNIIDQLGYWRMFAYKNQRYFLLFTQYETEDDSKRPVCLMAQTGLNDEYLVVCWFANNDSWFEVYKLTKEQWKSELAAQEQAMAAAENTVVEDAVESSAEPGSKLLRGQFSRPTLLFKARAPKFSPGSNNFQQLMKNTENQSNIGQGVYNHLYTQQVIDAKMTLVRDMTLPPTKTESTESVMSVPKSDPLPPICPNLLFIPAGTTNPAGIHSLAITWPITNQLLIYKISKSEAKGKDAFDTRPLSIWPFASRITSFTYDSKHEHLGVALQSGNICIIERTTGVNDLPSIQHITSSPVVDVHAIDSLENPPNIDSLEKANGFFVLSTDGKIYRIHFRSVLTVKKHHEQHTILPCFPQEQSKDASKIVRMIFFPCNPSNLFLTINELNRIYINDALKNKQLCEIVLPQSPDSGSFQLALVDNARSIIIGVREIDENSESKEFSTLRLYRVPLEHFPSLETFYPERIISSIDEIESTIEAKPTKTISSPTKKGVVIAEVDKTAIVFDEKIKELFRQRHSNASNRRERLRTRWNDIKLHYNPVYEQTT